MVENPRFALHSFPHASLYLEERFNDEEFYISGRAVAVTDHQVAERVAKTVGDPLESGNVFELSIELALTKHREKGRGVVYTKWKAT